MKEKGMESHLGLFIPLLSSVIPAPAKRASWLLAKHKCVPAAGAWEDQAT